MFSSATSSSPAPGTADPASVPSPAEPRTGPRTNPLPFRQWPARNADALKLAGFALLVVNVAYLAAVLWGGTWIVGPDGLPVHTDFTMVHAAGRLALDGTPAAAWDWTLHRAAENAVAGHAVARYYAWHYPPPFLLVATALATLPYAAAFVAWMAVTLPAYLATVRAIVGDRLGWLFAGAFPVLVPNLVPGQNGFFTAALIGGTLFLLDRRPVLAGICLGLLTYKPQYGVLFPLVLLATGRWTVILSAAATALLLGAVTLAVFGPGVWAAFFHWLPLTSHALLSGTGTEWQKFQSVFAMVRLLGGGATLAWALQGTVAALTAVGLVVLWRSRLVDADTKAAAVGLGVLLASPYVYLYDLAILAVPLAFLLRTALARGFLPGEPAGLALIAGLFLVLPVVGVPVGLLGVAVTAELLARRAVAAPVPQAV